MDTLSVWITWNMDHWEMSRAHVACTALLLWKYSCSTFIAGYTHYTHTRDCWMKHLILNVTLKWTVVRWKRSWPSQKEYFTCDEVSHDHVTETLMVWSYVSLYLLICLLRCLILILGWGELLVWLTEELMAGQGKLFTQSCFPYVLLYV